MTESSKNYLTTLTPLRGIAALLVVIFHCNLMCTSFLPPGYTSFVTLGWIWVDFFFLLSGFIMAYVYAYQFEGGISARNYWKYMGARFARVYPLHFFTLILAVAGSLVILSLADGLDPFIAAIVNPWAAPASLLMLQGMHLFMTAPLNTPSWSLSTEWWMYMIFPFLVPLCGQLKSVGKLMMLVFIGASYYFIMYYIGPMSGPFEGATPTINLVADFGFLRCAAGFLLGMLMYQVYRDGVAYSVLASDITFVVSTLACVIAMHFNAHELLIVAIFPFIILSAAHNTQRVKKFLDRAALQRLGDWSFSIYMVHVPIIYIFWIIDVKNNPKQFADFMTLIQAPPDYALGVTRLLIVLPATLIVAALTYRYIEIPTRNYFNTKFKARVAPVVS